MNIITEKNINQMNNNISIDNTLPIININKENIEKTDSPSSYASISGSDDNICIDTYINSSGLSGENNKKENIQVTTPLPKRYSPQLQLLTEEHLQNNIYSFDREIAKNILLTQYNIKLYQETTPKKTIKKDLNLDLEQLQKNQQDLLEDISVVSYNSEDSYNTVNGENYVAEYDAKYNFFTTEKNNTNIDNISIVVNELLNTIHNSNSNFNSNFNNNNENENDNDFEHFEIDFQDEPEKNIMHTENTDISLDLSNGNDSLINNTSHSVNKMLKKTRASYGNSSLNSISKHYNNFIGNDLFVKFYDIEPKKIDKVLDWCVSPQYGLLMLPSPFWILWFLYEQNNQLYFALSVTLSVFVILQTNPYIIKLIYGKPEHFDNLYIKKNIVEKCDKYIVEKRFQKLFIIIAIIVITFSTFGFIFFQLFDFEQSKNTPAQIFVILFSAITSIDNIQRILCNYMLSILIKHQKYLINKYNLNKFNKNLHFTNI